MNKITNCGSVSNNSGSKSKGISTKRGKDKIQNTKKRSRKFGNLGGKGMSRKWQRTSKGSR